MGVHANFKFLFGFNVKNSSVFRKLFLLIIFFSVQTVIFIDYIIGHDMIGSSRVDLARPRAPSVCRDPELRHPSR